MKKFICFGLLLSLTTPMVAQANPFYQGILRAGAKKMQSAGSLRNYCSSSDPGPGFSPEVAATFIRIGWGIIGAACGVKLGKKAGTLLDEKADQATAIDNKVQENKRHIGSTVGAVAGGIIGYSVPVIAIPSGVAYLISKTKIEKDF